MKNKKLDINFFHSKYETSFFGSYNAFKVNTKYKRIYIGYITILLMGLTSCHNFNECDCVIVTQNTLDNQGNSSYFKKLYDYCEDKDLNGDNQNKWNNAIKNCTNTD